MEVEVVSYEVEGWGVGELYFVDGRLVHHELPLAARVGDVLPERGCVLVRRLAAYFSGDPVSFEDVELDFGWMTPFQRAVADVLRAVPYGETVTYGELAALAGHPNAYRAAGSFCAQNRFPLFVPCHRVVAADGLGPYGSLGSDYKRRLLELEHAPL
jgi:methylated-DNA-[protein]-cysteine S-methyltransferase